MKITKSQLRKMLAESFKVSNDRFGFAGHGFSKKATDAWGKTNSFDPYRRSRINEQDELEVEDPEEEAWAGGENLENPVDHEKVYAPELVSERRIRRAIRKVLGSEK